MSMIGKVLGNRYEILEEIGVGGMATVYKAKDTILNRNVAIKILKEEFANDAEFIKRFQVEAQAAASLSHPNIVSVYDVGNEDNNHYIVMELIEGKTLKEIIQERGRIPWKEAVNIASQIASGLSKAHANHIVHRDIKPHNIIMTKDNVAKVTDFGIAKAVSNSTINAMGSTVGSVHYFSPEHARGGYTDARSDIYSLGVVLYEMVTGKLPFDADTPVSVALKHIQEEPKEPVEFNQELPIGVNNIIMKAMSKDISARYQTANEMYRDLMNSVKNPGDIPDAVVTIRKETEFPTQKIPVVGTSTGKKYNEENEGNEVKKGISKKQAIVKLVILLVVVIALFVVAFLLGNYLIGNLFVSAKKVSVPNLIGMEQAEAESKLKERNLILEVTGTAEGGKYPAGYVESQVQKEGTQLKENSKVGVVISKGEKGVLVPNVTGSDVTLDVAKIMIEQRGLVLKTEYEYDKEVPSGEIISQKPTVNTEVATGSIVTVTVSKGAKSGLIYVPNVIGDTQEKATERITEAKLLCEVTTINDPDKQNGIVISQIPEADKLLSELSTVTIVVNKVVEEKPTDHANGNGTAENKDPNAGKIPIQINLTNKGQRPKFTVQVTLEGTVIGGTRVEYEEEHSRSDGTITVYVTDAPGALLKLFIDGKLDSEKVL